MPDVDVSVEFKATGSRSLFHKGERVELDDNGKGTISVTPNEDDVLVATVREAQPGSDVEIKLKVPAGTVLKMVDFTGRVAKNRTVWASNRFFRLEQAS